MQPTKQSFTGFEPTKGKMHGVNTRKQALTLPKGGKKGGKVLSVQPHQSTMLAPPQPIDIENENSPLFFLSSPSKNQVHFQVDAMNDTYDFINGESSANNNNNKNNNNNNNKTSIENRSKHLLSNLTTSPSGSPECYLQMRRISLSTRPTSFDEMKSTTSSISSMDSPPQSPRMVLRDSTIQKQRKRNWSAGTETETKTPPAISPQTSFTPPILNQNQYALRSHGNSNSNNMPPSGQQSQIELENQRLRTHVTELEKSNEELIAKSSLLQTELDQKNHLLNELEEK